MFGILSSNIRSINFKGCEFFSCHQLNDRLVMCKSAKAKVMLSGDSDFVYKSIEVSGGVTVENRFKIN